jgi:hypothetical protein
MPLLPLWAFVVCGRVNVTFAVLRNFTRVTTRDASFKAAYCFCDWTRRPVINLEDEESIWGLALIDKERL